MKFKIIFRWITVAAYMFLIFYLSSIPLKFPETRIDSTKFVLHAIEYFILGMLLCWASKKVVFFFFGRLLLRIKRRSPSIFYSL